MGGASLAFPSLLIATTCLAMAHRLPLSEYEQTIFLGMLPAIGSLPNNPPPRDPRRNYTERDPLVIVPGMGCSQLHAQLHKSDHSPLFICPKETGSSWIDLWVSLIYFLPDRERCWAENFVTIFNATARTYSSISGLIIEPVDYGGIEGLSSLCPAIKKLSAYFGPFFTFLQKAGYQPGFDLLGAPFDFRLAGPETVLSNGQYERLKSLVEKTYRNTGRRVHLLGHSLGAPYISHFLAMFVDQAWKDKHIASMISLGGPFGGASMALPYSVSEMNWRAIGMSRHLFAKALHSFACLPWMVPHPAIFGDAVLVETLARNYTAAAAGQLLRDTGHNKQAMMLEQARQFFFPERPPQATAHIFYGYNVSTPQTYRYEDMTSFDSPPTITRMEDGDGVVSLASLLACTRWNQTAAHPVVMHPLDGMLHADMIWKPALWDAILDIIAR
ncbi:putative Lecithin:cholesterol acyltransferase [Paratrimastix pyriformis]|uniref:Lecithin:cholesterol acyltransferase n=1 Tax=Paratrimastix pyriformis TaxID=342808 RepID=A0ABQ8UB00_9EUKA|nr:putative Lecithin:cholesterol acyltransferase [Paratrimastix pyriformis]